MAKKETDGVYILKVVLYLILGSQWFWVLDANLTRQVPVPAGLIVGLLFASREKFQLDRKIEYALLLVAMLVGFWAHTGFNIVV